MSDPGEKSAILVPRALRFFWSRGRRNGTNKTSSSGDENGSQRETPRKNVCACAELLKDYKGMTEKVNIFAIFKKTPEYLK